MSDDAGIAARELRVRRGGRVILEACTFTLGPGLYLLRGANGSGKSTLLRALAGILHRAAGSVAIAGVDLDQDPVGARRRLGYAPETPDLFPYLTARELLETIAALREATVAEALEILGELGLHGREDERIGALSLGQRRKVTLAAAFLGDPAVLLLDEPLSGLDSAALAALCARLDQRRASGRTLLITSHDVGPLAPRCDGERLLRGGQVVLSEG